MTDKPAISGLRADPLTTKLFGKVKDSPLTVKDSDPDALLARMDAYVDPGVTKYIEKHGRAPAGHVDAEGNRPRATGGRPIHGRS